MLQGTWVYGIFIYIRSYSATQLVMHDVPHDNVQCKCHPAILRTISQNTQNNENLTIQASFYQTNFLMLHSRPMYVASQFPFTLTITRVIRAYPRFTTITTESSKRKQHRLKTTSLTYFSVYGEPQVPKKGSHNWVIAIFTMKLLKNKPLTIFGNGTQIRDFIHVDDIAEATILTAEKQSTIGKVINIGTGKPTTIRQSTEIVMNAADDEVPLEYRPRPKGDPFGGYAETTLMKKLMEWEPKIQLKDGVKRYHNWVSRNKNIILQWM